MLIVEREKKKKKRPVTTLYTGTGALQIAPGPGRPGVFSVFNYIDI